MIDLMRLQTFLYAAENLSFSTAARYMQISQPTVSHHIKALEDQFNVQLFNRTGGVLTLTEPGRLLLPHARKLVRQSIELEEMMASVQERVLGDIRIACSTTTGKYVLPQFAARFRQRHPGVTVSILRCTSEDVIPNLLEADASIGVVSFDVCGSPELECQEFFDDHIVLIVSADHPFAAREFIDPSELLDEPFIMREPSAGTRRVLLAELGKHDIIQEDMRIFLELGNAEAIVRTVQGGYGISFVSRLAADWALESGGVVMVPVAGCDLRRQIYMVQRSIREPNLAAEAFWAFVHDPANADLLRMAER